MTTYFQYNAGEKPMGEVLEFVRPNKRQIEHVDSSTIVEKIEMTPELQKAFEEAGYDIEDTNDDSLLSK